MSGRFAPVSKAKNTETASSASAASAGAESKDLRFEEAVKRLEAIVDSMESQDLPLETLLARYEEGSKLAQSCQAKLVDAELRIQQLDKNVKGELSLKPVNLPE